MAMSALARVRAEQALAPSLAASAVAAPIAGLVPGTTNDDELVAVNTLGGRTGRAPALCSDRLTAMPRNAAGRP